MNDVEIAQVVERLPMEVLEGKSVLLTGASGLLGSNLLSVLARARLSRLSIQVRSGEYLKPPGVDVYYADLSNAADCARLPNADIVISAAAYAQPLRFLADPLRSLRASAFGLMALLEKVNIGGRFLYISSSEVYCDCQVEPPYKESDIGTITPYHPRACYIQGKLFGEAMTYLYRARGISTVAVRPGIIYGPGFKKGDRRSWAMFVQEAVDNGKIELLDAGLVQRSFLYMADGIELILRALLDGTEAVYNIASPEPCSIAALARAVGKAAGVPVIIPKAKASAIAGTPQSLELDSTRAFTEFGKTDFTALADGLKRTIVWWRDKVA